MVFYLHGSQGKFTSIGTGNRYIVVVVLIQLSNIYEFIDFLLRSARAQGSSTRAQSRGPPLTHANKFNAISENAVERLNII